MAILAISKPFKTDFDGGKRKNEQLSKYNLNSYQPRCQLVSN